MIKRTSSVSDTFAAEQDNDLFEGSDFRRMAIDIGETVWCEAETDQAIQPMRRKEHSAMPVRSCVARSRAMHKDCAKVKTPHKHRLYDGTHHRRRSKWLSKKLIQVLPDHEADVVAQVGMQ